MRPSIVKDLVLNVPEFDAPWSLLNGRVVPHFDDATASRPFLDIPSPIT